MARIDEMRLMAKMARMYYTQGLRQTEICERLNVHQSTVSRVLKRAEREGIVRVTVSLPSGTHTEVEDALQARYGLDEAVVVEDSESGALAAANAGLRHVVTVSSFTGGDPFPAATLVVSDLGEPGAPAELRAGLDVRTDGVVDVASLSRMLDEAPAPG